MIRKALEDARQQRCGLGPGDLGRFWKGLGEGKGRGGRREEKGQGAEMSHF